MGVLSPGFVFLPTTPLAAGDYNFDHIGVAGFIGSISAYTFIFDVHAVHVVPEPASLSLLALGSLAALRRGR